MIQLRNYQIEIINKGKKILKEFNILYLALEVRTGKTLISLSIANEMKFKKVLFLTKKRAIDSIKKDFEILNANFEIQIINNESLHKITDNDFDLIISDEHHRLSAYPKPNKTAKLMKERFAKLPMIFLSGTPAIESGSQWYHSLWISNYSPFSNFRNFYQFANNFVNKKTRFFGTLQVPDYSDAKTDLIMEKINHLIITFTQKEAGFESEINENIIFYQIPKNIVNMCKLLIKDRCLIGKKENIIADTPVKLMSKLHQIENGTIIFESGDSQILNYEKAEFLREKYKNKKIAIFYYFKKEFELLKEVFRENLTNDLTEFNKTNKSIALQQVSGSEGISLKKAEFLIYYNIGYSGKNYVQSRDRMTTIDRKENNVFVILPSNYDSLTKKIYNVVKNKKKYSEKLFKKDYEIGK